MYSVRRVRMTPSFWMKPFIICLHYTFVYLELYLILVGRHKIPGFMFPEVMYTFTCVKVIKPYITILYWHTYKIHVVFCLQLLQKSLLYVRSGLMTFPIFLNYSFDETKRNWFLKFTFCFGCKEQRSTWLQILQVSVVRDKRGVTLFRVFVRERQVFQTSRSHKTEFLTKGSYSLGTTNVRKATDKCGLHRYIQPWNIVVWVLLVTIGEMGLPLLRWFLFIVGVVTCP